MNCFGQCLKVVKENGLEEKVLKIEKCFEQCRQIEERIIKLEQIVIKVENIKSILISDLILMKQET